VVAIKPSKHKKTEYLIVRQINGDQLVARRRLVSILHFLSHSSSTTAVMFLYLRTTLPDPVVQPENFLGKQMGFGIQQPDCQSNELQKMLSVVMGKGIFLLEPLRKFGK